MARCLEELVGGRTAHEGKGLLAEVYACMQRLESGAFPAHADYCPRAAK